MRMIQATQFTGNQGLVQLDAPKPQVSDGRVLVRVTAAGVTPLDHTIVSGGHPRAKAPLVLGNEGVARIIEAGQDVATVAVGRPGSAFSCPRSSASSRTRGASRRK